MTTVIINSLINNYIPIILFICSSPSNPRVWANRVPSIRTASLNPSNIWTWVILSSSTASMPCSQIHWKIALSQNSRSTRVLSPTPFPRECSRPSPKMRDSSIMFSIKVSLSFWVVWLLFWLSLSRSISSTIWRSFWRLRRSRRSIWFWLVMEPMGSSTKPSDTPLMLRRSKSNKERKFVGGERRTSFKGVLRLRMRLRDRRLFSF